MRRRFAVSVLPIVLLVTVAASPDSGRKAEPAEPGNASARYVCVDANAVALGGYDPLGYFDGTPRVGLPEITAVHAGAIYRFATEADRDRFKAEPARFVPQYGGFCAFGVAKGGRSPVDPRAYAIVDGKLYLNYNADVANLWDQDRAAFIHDADRNWAEMNAGK